jgi:hypothetical protein
VAAAVLPAAWGGARPRRRCAGAYRCAGTGDMYSDMARATARLPTRRYPPPARVRGPPTLDWQGGGAGGELVTLLLRPFNRLASRVPVGRATPSRRGLLPRQRAECGQSGWMGETESK